MSKPYFYLIKHKSTGKLYAGCQYGKKADSNNLLKPAGYLTSSKTVRKILKEEGLDSFEILKIIDTFDIKELKETIEKFPILKDKCLSLVYETKYLIDNDCSNNENYFNVTSYTVGTPVFTGKLKDIYKQKTGYENPSQNPNIKKKKQETSLKNYGSTSYIASEEGKKAIAETNLKKYGVKNVFANEEIKTKIKQNNKEKYGVEYHSQRPEIKEKISKANKGKIVSKETKEKLSKQNKDKVVVYNTITKQKEKISKELFDNNPDIYLGSTKGFVNVRDENNNIFMISKEDPRYISGKLKHMSVGVCKYLDENENIVYAHYSVAKEKGYKKVVK